MNVSVIRTIVMPMQTAPTLLVILVVSVRLVTLVMG